MTQVNVNETVVVSSSFPDYVKKKRGKSVKFSTWVLVFIVLFSLVFRLILAFQSPYYDNSAYAHIRHISAIEETGFPDFNDDSVVGNRLSMIVPLFHYLMAGFDFVLPEGIAFKLIPNILAVSSVVFVFLIAKSITKREESGLFAAFIASSIPVFVSETANSVSPLSLSIPLLLACLFFFIKAKKRVYAIAFVVCIIALVLTSPLSLILVLILLFYGLLNRIEGLRMIKHETELILFSSFLVFWSYFVAFKKQLVMHGVNLIFQNVPKLVESYVFGRFSVFESLVLIGIVPLLAGGIVAYKYLFTKKHKSYFLILSLIIVSGLLLWIGILPFFTSLILLGFGFAILFADSFSNAVDYLGKSKASKFSKLYSVFMVILILITMFLPAYYVTAIKNDGIVPEHDVAAIVWLKSHTSPDAVIATSPLEGAFVSYTSNRRVISDMSFIGVKNAELITNDLKTLYRTPWKTDALRICDEYGISYIMVTDSTRNFYDFEDVSYEDINAKIHCFRLVYNNYERVKIYEVACSLDGPKESSISFFESDPDSVNLVGELFE